jgi:hypothetical protein
MLNCDKGEFFQIVVCIADSNHACLSVLGSYPPEVLRCFWTGAVNMPRFTSCDTNAKAAGALKAEEQESDHSSSKPSLETGGS